MEIVQSEDNDYTNRIIMIPKKNELNSFYKVINHTDKMFCIRKIITETNLYKTNYDEITNEESNIYEAKLSDEFENEKIIKIRKTSINKYPIIYCSIVQYEI